ncbi:MAG: hypothetical protein V2J07_11250 [Anaerolineae bacterium]|jgi:hypothetical protein|nr:hypothetical protein [Anaerolineae bacterium]
MKKNLKSIAFIIGFLAILGMVYNLWTYSQLQTILIPENTTLPRVVDTYTIGILISFLFILAFHLLLLFHSIYFLPRMEKNFFLGALFFCGLVLSGLYLASDAALLHDLGNEYLLWDISMEWRLLFLASSLQLTLMVVGFIILAASKEKSPFSWFPKAEKFDESMFRIVTFVGLISGVLGLCMLPLPQLMGVGERYRDGYLITLTTLALLPFVSSLIYWLVRNRGKEFSLILDEKQFQDVSFGGLCASMTLSIMLFIAVILSTFQQMDLNNVLYSLFAIDLMVIIISGTVLLRSKI